MSTLHFAIALTVGTYAYVLLPDWVGMAALTSLYVIYQAHQDDAQKFIRVFIQGLLP